MGGTMEEMDEETELKDVNINFSIGETGSTNQVKKDVNKPN